MIKNYLKVAYRYLLRHKEYTAINILGLAVGITCCILIMLFVKSEFSYDTLHEKSGRLYRAWQDEKYQGQDLISAITCLPMANALQTNYPEVESTCRVYAFKPVIKIDQNSFAEDVRMVDASFFRMFSFKLVRGNAANPFPDKNSVIITEEIADKYFGHNNPVGQKIEMQLGDDKILFSVAGIIKSAPEESSIKYKLIIPYSSASYLFRPRMFNSWGNVFTETYVLLKPNVNEAALEKKFPVMVKTALGEDYKEGGFMVHLQPIKDIHLDTTLPSANEPTSNPKYAYILATIGILILLVACVNFITLSIGRSSTRAMEVGVRKALGAERSQLIKQFWGEAFLVTLVSVVVGLVLASLLIHPFNQLINRNLLLQFNVGFIGFCFLMIALIALIAGIYPAIILSGFNPVEVLKGKLKMKGNTGWLRQSLVVGQFVTSIAMIICTITIGKQMNYLKNKDLGYNKDQVVVIQTNKSRKDGTPLAALYRQELLKHPEVKDASVSVYSLAEFPWVDLGFTDEKKIYHDFQYNSVDANFLQSMHIPIIQGRAFDPNNASDITNAAVVNEAFVAAFGLVNPVGQKLPGKFEQQIIGVAKDFNFESLHTKVKPLLLTILADSVFRHIENISYNSPPQPRISVRLKPGNLTANINVLQNAWKVIAPTQDFDYQFLDDTVSKQYETEQRTNTIVKIASAISIFIAGMGLFGLATLSVVRRTKEIGIRKILGANVFSLVQLLSTDFIRLIVIAAIIAIPLAWWFMDQWLNDFAYRAPISWWVFAVSAFAALLIALLTISYQAIKAALANPVKSIRTE